MPITAATYVGSGHLNSALGRGARALTAEPAPWLSSAPHRAPHATQCGLWACQIEVPQDSRLFSDCLFPPFPVVASLPNVT